MLWNNTHEKLWDFVHLVCDTYVLNGQKHLTICTSVNAKYFTINLM